MFGQNWICRQSQAIVSEFLFVPRKGDIYIESEKYAQVREPV